VVKTLISKNKKALPKVALFWYNLVMMEGQAENIKEKTNRDGDGSFPFVKKPERSTKLI